MSPSALRESEKAPPSPPKFPIQRSPAGSDGVACQSHSNMNGVSSAAATAPHTHPNKQWIYLMAGRLKAVVDGEAREVGPGELIYIPAEIVHSVDVLPGDDAKFFTCKDLRHGIAGTRVE